LTRETKDQRSPSKNKEELDLVHFCNQRARNGGIIEDDTQLNGKVKSAKKSANLRKSNISKKHLNFKKIPI